MNYISKDPVLNRSLEVIPKIIENLALNETTKFAFINFACANRYLDLAHKDFETGSKTSGWMSMARDSCEDFMSSSRNLLPYLVRPMIKQLQGKIREYDVDISMEFAERREEVFA